MAGLAPTPFELSQSSSSTLKSENESSDYTSPSSRYTSTRDSSSVGTADVAKAETQRSRSTRPALTSGFSSARISRIQSITRRQSWAAGFTHRLSHVKTSPESIVDFEGPDDPYHPRNWPFRKKVITTLLYACTTSGITIASSIYSPAIEQICEEFHVGREVSLLGISLMLVGFSLGTPLWAPLSEIYGRKPAVLIPTFISAAFAFGTATAKDIQTVLLTRFFSGLFGSAPVTNTGGMLGDMWNPTQRGSAMVAYGFAVNGGAVIGPVIGGAVVQSYLGWRWTQYLIGIFQMTTLFLDVLILDESYPPRLLVYKARRLRVTTGNWSLHARFEEWDVTLKEMVYKFGVRPVQMLLTPVCFSVSLYNAFGYGLIYAALDAFPFVFREGRGWNPLVGSLPFLAILIGMILGGAVNVLNNSHYYNRRYMANGNKAVPEARLPPMMVGAVFFAAGLFIFGWTGAKEYPWIASCIGAMMVGLGFYTIYQSTTNYVVDTFPRYAASAVAVQSFMRALLAAAFPLIIHPMYRAIGIGWATSVFACFGVALIPIPFLLFVYGPKLRAKGKYSRNIE